MPDVLIASATRSAIGRAKKGSLVDTRPDDLVATVIRAAVADARIDPGSLDDHALGTAYPEGRQGSNLARRVVPLAGLPITVPATTVNRFCASSLQALRMGAHAIWSGEAHAYLASGVESISQVGRTTTEHDKHPALTAGGIADMYIPMGLTAERVAREHGISRADMDAFALRSHRRAIAAQDDGSTAREITPVPLPDGTLFTQDDGPRRDSSLEALHGLRPVFADDGVVTAGNACPLNDGAAAAVLVSDVMAQNQGLAARARIVATSVSGLPPEIMGVGPIEAVRKILAATGTAMGDIDAIEFNEAFASQVLASARATGMDIDNQVNLRGGSIALGHPFGMSGIRLVTTLLTTLEEIDGTLGMVTLCVGGGQGMALLLERV
ncbi:acetyl-CoA C-acyltransferase [Aeromicrobium wangtongii]|uniref:acetyl-CoA C-acyltransferase n=1 Tax=Aeromicrobium wangtongii TaxID=2969247 RepID=A0ABY5M9W9_9ACTN|nr:acetyl-CoA C-acyltransferase [Aeromicrobium wangtongii]MCD9199941.1 acetyl-CoA C-acyltransferase [Aeromicrobium wangtongii]UUP13557.1 acetyl-CoA C-acyltransferase [Aeromicrobium wangtongii]